MQELEPMTATACRRQPILDADDNKAEGHDDDDDSGDDADGDGDGYDDGVGNDNEDVAGDGDNDGADEDDGTASFWALGMDAIHPQFCLQTQTHAL